MKTIPAYVDVDSRHCGYVDYSRGNCLGEVYGCYSANKARAWERCERLCSELDGSNLCITSNNSHTFTVQFEFYHPENGRPMVCHITPSRKYAMYLDMHHIDTARDAWMEYATIFANTTVRSDLWDMYDVYDGVHVVWVSGVPYVIAHDETYRIDNAWTAKCKFRKRVKLQRVGTVDDTVINRIIDSHQAVCGSVLPCMVHVSGENSRCIVYAHLVTDDMPFDRFVGWDAIMPVRCSLVDTVAMCVDACMMIHGYDAQGATVRLMD